MIKVVEIRINGEGGKYSHFSIDANYKLINIVVYYEGSDGGAYRAESFQQVSDTGYLVFMEEPLNKDSYVNAYCVLIRK